MPKNRRAFQPSLAGEVLDLPEFGQAVANCIELEVFLRIKLSMEYVVNLEYVWNIE